MRRQAFLTAAHCTYLTNVTPSFALPDRQLEAVMAKAADLVKAILKRGKVFLTAFGLASPFGTAVGPPAAALHWLMSIESSLFLRAIGRLPSSAIQY